MADKLDFDPSAFAADMQLRTRKTRNFDKIEHDLPDPKSAAFQKTQATALSAPVNVSAWLSRFAQWNPFGKAVDAGDIVWLMDNTAYRNPETDQWEAEFVAAVFENEPKCRVADIVSGIASTLGLADDAAERDVIEKRIIPFLWDIQAARVFWIEHKKKEIKLGPTSINGITTSVEPLHHAHKGSVVDATALVPQGTQGLHDMQTYYAGPEGWAIISDVDDTIKVTLTSDPLGILKTTFVDEPIPVPGMPELYSELQTLLPRDTPWFYLSASPYNLYPLLREFRDRYFPQGTLILRDSSWRTVAGLLSALTMGTEEYKADRMKKIHSWLPKRKLILIGDSTQSDPEAYGEIYRTFPGWVKMILIRKATDVAAIGIEEKNQLERFEKAFKNVPVEAWHVFEEPNFILNALRSQTATLGGRRQASDGRIFIASEGHVYRSIMKKKKDTGNIIYHRGSFLLASERKSSTYLVLITTVTNGHTAASFEQGIKILYQSNTFEFEVMSAFMEFQRNQIAPDLNHLLTHVDTRVSIEFNDLVCYGSELEKTGRPQPIKFTILCHTLSKMRQDLKLRFHVDMSNREPWHRHTAESKRLAGQAIKTGLETLVGNGRVTCVLHGCGMDGFSELVKGIRSEKLEAGLKLNMCPHKPPSRYETSSEEEQDGDASTDGESNGQVDEELVTSSSTPYLEAG
ncbi:actin filament organization app1 [Fusarium tjaetaba]|uniref:Actin filament organization app1 n=1 Tax=Fusarium tjaetaba TaxID=1567544 RepID=A0A8H5SI02_9HYPO|nr:actin filament organization app1 [Fusarium tjaetaba]KAF5651299.1 actin filament organization app1 [Fusarium tjaetaba]